jgi:hypothetical protein
MEIIIEFLYFKGLSPENIGWNGTIGRCFDRGFVSTSLDIDTAFKFSDGDCCIITFTLPDNIHAWIDTRNNSGKKRGENEVILERNIEFFDITYTKNFKGARVYSCGVRYYPMTTQDERQSIWTVFYKLKDMFSL